MESVSYNFQCFRNLREKMFKTYYNMYPFEFSFNNVNTFAAAFIITSEEREVNPQLKYVLFRLSFMKQNDLDDEIECFINVNGITEYDDQSFRTFFSIQGKYGYRSYIEDFCKDLASQCPPDVFQINNNELLRAEKHSLCKRLNLDPEHCYRKAIVRLGNKPDGDPRKRNPNTYQLAVRLFPHASKQYASDTNVSYSFTENKDEEVTEELAISRFIKRENIRLRKKR